MVGVDLGGCDVCYSPQGLTFGLGLATKVSLLAASEKEVLIALTDEICVWQIQGMLVDDEGQGISGQWIHASSERGGGTQVQSESGGAFAITIPAVGTTHSAQALMGAASTIVGAKLLARCNRRRSSVYGAAMSLVCDSN